MEPLLKALESLEEFRALLRADERGEHTAISGVAQICRSHMIAAFCAQTKRKVTVLCLDDMAAQRTAQELSQFLGFPAQVLTGRELTLYDASAASRGWEQKRLRQLYALCRGETRLQVMSLEAACLRTMPPRRLLDSAITLKIDEDYSLRELSEKLILCGYTRSQLVEGVGQFAIRGGILDIYSPAEDQPVRIEFFGDTVDAMGYFDPISQRRTENIDSMVILPVAETLPQLHEGGVAGLCEDISALIARQKRRRRPNPELIKTLEGDLDKLQSGVPFPAADRYMTLIYPEFCTAADYIPADSAVFFCDHGNLRRSERDRSEEMGMYLDSMLASGTLAGELCDFQKGWEDFCESLKDHMCVFFDSFLSGAFPAATPPKQLLSVTAKQLPSYGGNLEAAVSDLTHYRKNHFATLVLCANRRRGETLQELLAERGIKASLMFPCTRMPKPDEILLVEGSLPNGMEYPEIRLAVLSEGQLLSRREERKPRAKAKAKTGATNRQKLSSFADLSPGDLVVHEHHGIGRYVCMEQIRVDGTLKDYVKIAYQGTDVLYVPATQLDMVSKYIGAGEDSPMRLNKLGGDAWTKTKARTKKAVKDMADQLVKLYAERSRLPGYAFSGDSPWQTEFEDSFEYMETDDQIRCIEEIKGDMCRATPMDRLLCGDVGFGKTEVALRAAMKAMLDSKQVAILVPTTVLAQQHFATATKRFAGYPVTIDVLSRFRTSTQQKRTLAGLRSGTVDLIIGTHKLLSKTVEFKDLGLLIVDEEQRFGVSHKERLKELAHGVDVLTLSATPIPRTLNMALSGIRDMSTLEEPPQDRYPVQTFVMEYAEPVIDDAIRRELARGGQVYYLHNHVESIEQCAAAILKRIPEARIAVGHGKMNEEQLGDVMQRMADGEIDILVCTTIIETGIDIPNVNTLIIESADRFGLAQLHQLRGRVGRSGRHAFAYLTFRRGKTLTEIAEKRLNAIRDFAEFGSGFKLAMRDLEIRGAGNLLGAEQSGHLMSVGYDMYLKLLEDAVLEERGERKPGQTDCTADLTITASIDPRYVENGEQRMDLYRRMAAIRSREDADELLDEIVDRYGDPPKGVMNLIAVALLRSEATQVGIVDITQKQREVRFTMSHFEPAAVSALCALPEFHKRCFVSAAGDRPVLTVRQLSGEDPLRLAEVFVEKFTTIVKLLQNG
ncbi:MAG: transcription-repair coupling factor [Ruminococcaceae bacterium]|nr:transcription-repair coupling factor [Oscillospiraceae bacterium]